MTSSRTLAAAGTALVSLIAPVVLWATPTSSATSPPPPTSASTATSTTTTTSGSIERAAARPPARLATAHRGAVLFGDVRRPQVLTTSRLAALPQQSVTTTFSARGVPSTRTFTGPLLLDVIALAQPRFDETRNNDRLAFAIRVGATDGYRAVIAYGEIDPAFANTQVLLALTEDGRTLDRPRLVVPGDIRGGRYVTDVNSVAVVDLGR